MHCARAEFKRIPTGLRRLVHRPAIVREEAAQSFSPNRPLGNDPDPFQEAGVTMLESNQRTHATLEEGACVNVVPTLHRRPLCQRSAKHNLEHARPHVVVYVSGRNQVSEHAAARKHRQKGGADAYRAVLALVTWEAGLITTRPLLQ